jgi:hypothetical protein
VLPATTDPALHGAEAAKEVARESLERRRAPGGGAACRCSSGVEQLTCNQQVVGSTPTIGSRIRLPMMMERYPSGQREQTVNLPANAYGGSNPPLSTRRVMTTTDMTRGSSSGGRARAFQARGRGFDSRLPLLKPPGARAVLARFARCAPPIPPDPAPHAAKPRAASGAGRSIGAIHAHVAQAAEHFLGKEEVTGSNPVVGSSH